MASACLPLLFRAVEIGGVPYWDGGYSGNPAVSPFLRATATEDTLIVQINPLRRRKVPTGTREIMSRVNEINFNASLLSELREVEFVNKLIDEGRLPRGTRRGEFRRIRLHRIALDDAGETLGARSALNTDFEYFETLHKLGPARHAALSRCALRRHRPAQHDRRARRGRGRGGVTRRLISLAVTKSACAAPSRFPMGLLRSAHGECPVPSDRRDRPGAARNLRRRHHDARSRCLVNAANASLLGGGGVDGAIHRAAGPELLAECRTLGGCDTGSAKITRGYRLKATHVIHAVGPVWNGGGRGEDDLLASCYRTALSLAAAHRLASIAFPAISTGIYRFPADRAAQIAVGTVASEIANAPGVMTRVVFCCFSPDAAEHHKTAFAELGLA